MGNRFTSKMQSEFNFFQHWYPIYPIEDLQKDRPTAVTILGIRLVVWKPGKCNTYQVFLDQCPHRLAPLSEGFIDEKTGNLVCSYHGWEFDSQGICTRIPQAEKPEWLTKHSQDFCVHRLPCRQENGLLWVWLDPKSPEQASTTPLPLSPKANATEDFVWSSYARDLEYDWQTLVENLVDPSHVPFAHHGLQGKREQARPIPINIVESTQDLIKATNEGISRTVITFKPPCYLEYDISFGNEGKRMGLVTYCIPVLPGKSRIIAQFPRNFGKTLFRLTPRWWEHIKTRNQVIDGDMIILHQQEHFLQQKKPVESWKTAYKLPTSADRLVIEYRNWFDKYCHSQLPWYEVGLTTPESATINENREELLDHYKQHTQNCSSCRGALRNLQRLQWVLLGYFAIAVSGVAVLPDALRVKVGLPLIVLAVLGLGLYTWLKFWLSPKFYFVDYVHAER